MEGNAVKPLQISQRLIEDLLHEQFSDDEGELSRFDLQEKELERLPFNAVEIANFEADVDHSPGLTWQISCTYFAVPIDPQIGTYVLFVLTWDDNWGCWQWEAQGGVSDATSIQSAGKFLMAQLAKERMSVDGSAYYAFLKKFL